LTEYVAPRERGEREYPVESSQGSVSDRTEQLRKTIETRRRQNNAWGITARDQRGVFPLDGRKSARDQFVRLHGQASAGEKLVDVAGGLAQVLVDKRYNDFVAAPAHVPMCEDIGFLSGSEEEKMRQCRGAFDDNFDVLQRTADAAGEWGRPAMEALI
ncbi:hypothetical protein CF640_37450, partial [Burkholderia pseudomallei]